MMRKIEKDMLQAIKDRRNWQSGNTQVKITQHNGVAFCDVLLHGNWIADMGEDGTTYPNLDVIRNWPTMTTRSRLRALGINASIKDGQMLIDGEAI